MTKLVGIALEVARVMLPYIGLSGGPVLLTSATVALYRLFDPEAMRDGQFGMIYLVTVPFGLIIGGVVGASGRLACARRRRAAGRCAQIGGLLVVLLVIVLALMGGFPFGYLEALLLLAVAGGLSIVGAWMVGSAVRDEHCTRPAGKEASL